MKQARSYYSMQIYVISPFFSLTNILISLFIWAVVGILTFFAYVIISFISLFLGKFEPDGKLAHAQAFWWSKAIVSINPFWKFTIQGIENIRKDTTYVLICNHQSMADIILLSRMGRQFKWVIKESLFKVPVFGGCLAGAKYIKLKRDDQSSIREVYKKMIYWLRKGVSVCVFPEGSRSPDGRLLDFKNGSFKIAIKEKKPIIPIAIKGTYNALPKGSWVFKKHVSGEVRVLPAIDTSNYEAKDFAALRDLVRGKIKAALQN